MNSLSSVIKSCEVQLRPFDWQRVEPPRPPDALDPEEVRQSLVAAALAQGEQVLREAREQAAEITRQARLEGLAAAEAETGQMRNSAQAEADQLRHSAQAEADQLLLAARGVLDEVRAWGENVMAQSEAAVLDLVAGMARTIFGDGLALDPEVLQAAFARALENVAPLGDLRIHIHPDDAALLEPHWPEQQARLTGQRLELVPDAAIRRGGCLVEGEYGSVDARVETQLQLVQDAFSKETQR